MLATVILTLLGWYNMLFGLFYVQGIPAPLYFAFALVVWPALMYVLNGWLISQIMKLPLKGRLSALLICGAVLFFGYQALIKDETRGQQNICEVHRLVMSKKAVPIQYGLPAFSEADRRYGEEASRRFPHAPQVWLGGCIVRYKSRARVYSCQACEQAFKQWRSQNPSPNFAAQYWWSYHPAGRHLAKNPN
jgi:hypothetical protein